MEAGNELFQPDLIIGPIEAGTVVSSVLFGCAMIQTYMYFTTFEEDSRGFKGLVLLIMGLLFVHLVCVIDTLWQMTILTYGFPQALGAFSHVADAVIILGSVITLCVQAFYIYRLVRLSSSWILPAICTLVCVVSCVLGLVLGITALRMTSMASYEVYEKWAITACLVVAALADVAITGSLVYHMGSKFAESSARTDRIIEKSILWAIETGFITSFCALLVLIFFFTMKQNYIWVGTYGFVAPIYANCFLAVLNGRARLRHRDGCACKCYPSVKNVTVDGEPYAETTLVVDSQMSQTCAADTRLQSPPAYASERA
ncbi:hypothetical protein CONPUDRAFT_144196 [Coniophora puteana RWD-64-598 SS2]|uniref:DUF6534 domain-containing protein n=1 Tax=Coniophora puteana (strain RWD-64-598) TaxID=741705 RepID=A0A5M3MSA1_CONPW|nr:uncharacterized protein CONPUDRAFT_144196 [Coniophora puteana RWD-64-598 SS2]EIW81411.1 hypothetical protein CONPUDRAFT_144196 [Coniophora puteana RWD-64-598 SS2]